VTVGLRGWLRALLDEIEDVSRALNGLPMLCSRCRAAATDAG
jgi:hypothetical protein